MADENISDGELIDAENDQVMDDDDVSEDDVETLMRARCTLSNAAGSSHHKPPPPPSKTPSHTLSASATSLTTQSSPDYTTSTKSLELSCSSCHARLRYALTRMPETCITVSTTTTPAPSPQPRYSSTRTTASPWAQSPSRATLGLRRQRPYIRAGLPPPMAPIQDG